jgi:hypothetical protein
LKLIATLLCLAASVLAAEPSGANARAHCNLAALSKAERARDQQLVPVLRDALRERKDLPEGFAYRFEPAVMKDVGEWLQIVAKCCQPLTYDVSLEPQPGGALWVRITGHESKEFIDLEFAPLTQKLAAQGGMR